MPGLSLGGLAALALLLAPLEHGNNLALLGAVIGLLLVAAGGTVLARRDGPAVAPHPLLAALFLLWGWAGVAGLLGEVRYSAWLAWWTLGAAPLAAVVGGRWAGRPGAAARRIGLLLALAAALALHGLWQRFAMGEQARSLFLNPHTHEAFLSLASLPALALLARRLGAPPPAPRPWLLAAACLLVVFAIAVNGGRGSTLSLGAGVAVLVALGRGWGRMGWRALGRVVALVLGAYLAAALLAPGSVERSVGGLAAETGSVARRLSGGPALAARPESERDPAQRLLLWGSTLRLIREMPWHGVGPGNFWQAFARYRDPRDASAGFHAHNDYLELLAELGWPGLGLLAVLMALVAHAGARAVRARRAAGGSRAEAIGLLAALGGLAVHSLVTFNLYALAVLALAGLYLGRLSSLAGRRRAAPGPAPGAGWRARPGLRLATVLAVGLGLVQLTAMAAADLWTRAALREMETGELDAARAHLERALRAFESDRPLLELARIYTHALGRAATPERRRRFYHEGMSALARAEKVNPLRPETPLLRAALLETAGPLAGERWAAQAEAAYRQALRLDARLWSARTGLLELLERGGRGAEAEELVGDGLRYAWGRRPSVLLFYAAVARRRLAAGDTAGASSLYARMERIGAELGLAPEALARLVPGRRVEPPRPGGEPTP